MLKRQSDNSCEGEKEHNFLFSLIFFSLSLYICTTKGEKREERRVAY